MKRNIRVALALGAISAVLLAPMSAPALILSQIGNAPTHDPGWPEGALAVANLKCRAGWWEGPPFGGGEYQFLYRGATETFMQALTAFAAIRAPALELVLHDGPQTNQFLGDSRNTNADTRVDWSFTVWVPANWHRLYNNPKSVFMAGLREFHQPVDPPRLDVYISGGLVDWAKVKVPANVRVRDERDLAATVHPVGGALVRVEVFDMATGKPVPGARVTVATLLDPQKPQAGYRTVAEAAGDDSGRVEVAKLPAGTHRVAVASPGYAPRILEDYGHYAERTFKNFTAELAGTAALRGTATDTDGRPLSNVTVRAFTLLGIDGRGYGMPDPSRATTDADGNFELAGLPAGYVQLFAEAPGYYFSDSTTIHDVPDVSYRNGGWTTNGVVLRLSRAGEILVSVTDKAGKPLSRFEGNPLMVEVERREGLKTDPWAGGTVKEDGTYEFVNVPPGEYRITSRPNPSSSGKPHAPEQIVTVVPGVRATVKVVYE